MNKRGFTLIELLVVISILGVLAALIVNNLNDSRARARDARKKQNLQQLKTALQMYYNDYQTYPANDGTEIQGCGATGTTTCTDSFSAGSEPNIYMTQLPEFTSYTQTDSGDGFTLMINLENASDPNLSTSQTQCLGSPDSSLNFYVCAE
jgi:type II secretion system protein G